LTSLRPMRDLERLDVHLATPFFGGAPAATTHHSSHLSILVELLESFGYGPYHFEASADGD
jgi:hypothetical protein